MKKTAIIAVILILGVCGSAFANAQSFLVPESTSHGTSGIPESSKLTKWEALSFLGRGEFPEGTEIDASYSEEELNGIIEAELETNRVQWFMDQASIKLFDGYAEFSARMLRPIKGNLLVRATVRAENGKPKIEVTYAKYGIFRVPASFVERVGNFVLKKKSISEWFDVKNAKWESIKITKDGVRIRVSAKDVSE